jgi:hypothetical protein
MQQCNKGPRPEVATLWQQEDRGPLRQTAATFWKQEGNERDLLEDLQAGDIEVSCRETQQIEKNEGMDLVEGSTPPKWKKKLHTEQELDMWDL